MDPGALFLGLAVSLVGSGYILYGRRQSEPWFIACGFALVVYPYFTSSTLATLLVGVLLAAVPFVVG